MEWPVFTRFLSIGGLLMGFRGMRDRGFESLPFLRIRLIFLVFLKICCLIAALKRTSAHKQISLLTTFHSHFLRTANCLLVCLPSPMRTTPTGNEGASLAHVHALSKSKAKQSIRLSWGEWANMSGPFTDGYFVWVSSVFSPGWLYLKNPPRVILPSEFAYSLN